MSEIAQTTPAVVLGPTGQPTNPEVLDRRENNAALTATNGTLPTAEVKAEVKAEPSLLNGKPEVKPAAQGAPDKYDIKLPEGVTLAEAQMTEATTMFKELGLTQEAAQKMVDFHVKTLQAAQDAPMQTWKAERERMQNELKSDPEIGGKLDTVKATVSKALDSIAGPELAAKFKEFMDYSGAGNNVHFAKVFFKMAQQLTEGGHVSGNGPSPLGQTAPGAAPPSAAHALYPKLS